MDDKRKIHIGFKVPKEIHSGLKRLAEMDHLSMNEELKLIVRRAIEQIENKESMVITENGAVRTDVE